MQNNFNTNSHIFFLRAINFIEKILKRKIQFLLFLKKFFFSFKDLFSCSEYIFWATGWIYIGWHHCFVACIAAIRLV